MDSHGKEATRARLQESYETIERNGGSRNFRPGMTGVVHPFVRAGFGMKGGRGPTAGRKASTFLVRFPDGGAARKRCFFVDALVDGRAVIYQDREGVWKVQAVFDPAAPPAWVSGRAFGGGPHIIVDAERVA